MEAQSRQESIVELRPFLNLEDICSEAFPYPPLTCITNREQPTRARQPNHLNLADAINNETLL